MHISRKYAILFVCLLCPLVLSAQTDKVYLKNGSRIKGELTLVNSQEVKIRTDSSSEISLSTQSILSIRRKIKTSDLTIHGILVIDSLNRILEPAHFYHQLQFGLMPGNSNFNTGFSNATFNYGYFKKLKGKAHVGVNIGLDYYASFRVMPIYLEYRKDLGRMPSKFFFYAKAGFSRATSRNFVRNVGDVHGNLLYGLGIGYEWKVGSSRMQFTIGTKHQDLKTERDTDRLQSLTYWDLNRIEFKIGLRL